jgi:hypothetical protein
VLANVFGLAFSNTRGLSVPSFYILYALRSFPFRPLILSVFFFFWSLSFVSGAGRSSPVLVDGENATTLTVPHRKLLERGESFSFFFSISKYEFDFIGSKLSFGLGMHCLVWCQRCTSMFSLGFGPPTSLSPSLKHTRRMEWNIVSV